MSNENKSAQPVRYVTKSLRLECWVSHRDANEVVYFFENDPDAKYVKSPAAFDANYVLPGKR